MKTIVPNVGDFKPVKNFLVPTRRVGMQSQRAALRNRPQRGHYKFPRSAWELDKPIKE